MAQGAIDINQPEAQQNRTELTLGQVAREWKFQPRGEQFTEALLSFLKSIESRDTLKSYSFSLLQFFAWYWQKNGRLTTPDRISRGDAAEFTRWLRTRSVGLTRWWLEQDPTRRTDLHIYDIVSKDPGVNLDKISRSFGAYTPNARSGLAHRLACLVKRRTLDRRPTVAEWRREHGGLSQPPEDLYRYTIAAVRTPEGPERASSMTTRLAALASLWSFMIRSGENVPGSTDPLLRHNIWSDSVKQARAQAPSHQEAGRQAKKPGLQLFLRMLATTYRRTHGELAFEAAKAAFLGQPEIAGRRMIAPTFKDIRDRALLLMMAQTGVRVREVSRLRRQDVSGDPPLVTIIGKRGKKKVIMMPPPTLKALRELSTKLRTMAAQQTSGRAERLLEGNAPLFPAVAYWGANAGQREGGLTRPGIALLINRRAEAAGIEPGTPDFQRAHPHGLRALFITYALETGTPIHRVQAIVGHASVATTGRYAEERAPEMLIADVFRKQPPLPPPVTEAPTVTVPERTIMTEITPPRAPRPKPIARPRPPTERHALAEAPPPAPPVPAERVPVIAPPPVEPTRVEDMASDIARWRREPITVDEQKTLRKCVGLRDNTLQHLCVIYDLHWGEKGNRQVLVSTGGGRKFKANREAEDEDEDEDEFDPMAALAEVDDLGMKRIAEIARAGSSELHAEAGTDKLNRIYSGKDSGLTWWTGTQGRLKPEMPVMSPSQFGISEDLVKLWQKWFDDSPTKAEALVRWLGEALDTAAQLEGEILRRDGGWVPAQAPWPVSEFKGSRRQPEPREVFREHLPQEVVAWFKVRGGAFRVSSGDPETWQHKTAKPKVLGETAPDWFTEDDPVRSLPIADRRALLDWLLALSGQLPTDTEPRFSGASRADLARLLGALCQFDQAVDSLRESEQFGPQFAASLLRQESVDQIPSSVRPTFQEAQSTARSAMSSATNGRVIDFDAYALIKKRVRESGEGRRSTWAMQLVEERFGPEAAADPALKLVAKCGDVPLGAFKDLFRVSGETIVHTAEFKRAFAEQFGSHSECVARRIARQLWEIKQGRAVPKEAVDKPQHMVTLVEVMRTFKVPCTEAQEYELKQLVPWLDKPEGIRQEFAKVRTAAGSERDELSEAELQEQELAEAHEEAIVGALRAEHFAFHENPRQVRLPTPVHLMLALV